MASLASSNTSFNQTEEAHFKFSNEKFQNLNLEVKISFQNSTFQMKNSINSMKHYKMAQAVLLSWLRNDAIECKKG